MNYGLKTSKSEYDVNKVGLTELTFTSEKNLFKIAQKGTWQMNLSYTHYYDEWVEEWMNEWEGITTIIHNLEYIPTFEVWGQKPKEQSSNYFKWIYNFSRHARIGEKVTIVADLTKIQISYYTYAVDDLYVDPERTTLNGIYSIYVDPML